MQHGPLGVPVMLLASIVPALVWVSARANASHKFIGAKKTGFENWLRDPRSSTCSPTQVRCSYGPFPQNSGTHRAGVMRVQNSCTGCRASIHQSGLGAAFLLPNRGVLYFFFYFASFFLSIPFRRAFCFTAHEAELNKGRCDMKREVA